MTVASLLPAALLLGLVAVGGAIKCYQCSTDEDPKGKDLCGAYEPFDETVHIPVDCLQEESVTPGTFCIKITKQSPRMFISGGSEIINTTTTSATRMTGGLRQRLLTEAWGGTWHRTWRTKKVASGMMETPLS